MTSAAEPQSGLNPSALRQLLARLAADSDAGAREYNVLRERLADFFQWRGAASPEALADETLDRVAHKMAEGCEITNLKAFVYGVARNIALEAQKRQRREREALAELERLGAPGAASEETEAEFACLSRCLAVLPPHSRALIVRYYQGQGRSHEVRTRLAAELAISYESLKMRAYRIRLALEACLRRCLGGGAVTVDHEEPLSGSGSPKP
jgi:DNA-directed RNA polymerase specialized sigma24 family protein